jgi:hypothetical protein
VYAWNHDTYPAEKCRPECIKITGKLPLKMNPVSFGMIDPAKAKRYVKVVRVVFHIPILKSHFPMSIPNDFCSSPRPRRSKKSGECLPIPRFGCLYPFAFMTLSSLYIPWAVSLSLFEIAL